MKTIFLRALKVDDKASALLSAARAHASTDNSNRFDVDPTKFATIPRSPFAYWVSEQLRSLFKDLSPFEAHGRELSIGASTKDDFRYVRAQFEVLPSKIACSRIESATRPWVTFVKGGAFSPFYTDIHLLINWLQDGVCLKADISDYRGSRGWGYQWSAALNGHDRYFRSGISWTRRTQRGLSMRAMPAGCIFADKGPAAFVVTDDSDVLLALLAIANSLAFKALVNVQMAFGSYEVGVIERTPVPELTGASVNDLAKFARRAWSLKRFLDTRTETAHAFGLPALLQVSGADLVMRSKTWTERVSSVESELTSIQADIDDACFGLYRISDSDREATIKEFGAAGVDGTSSDDITEVDSDLTEDGEEPESKVDAEGLAAELVSWAIGVAFGRFDLRLVTGTRSMPVEPDPFTPLPACSPGMLTGEDRLPVVRAPPDYPLEFPENGVLVDEPGHGLDLTGAVRAIFDIAFDNNADRWLYDVAAILETTGHDLRTWLSKNFFDFHLKRYSKSRRRAPIFWQLSTYSGRYSVFLYSHRLTRDTFFQLQTDVVGPKLALEERRLTSLIQTAGIDATASQRREIDEQKAVVEEVTGMLDDIKRIAPLWSPNLDDGIVLTMAPLWRLVPQHRSWQKELKTKWDELIAGKYDWAHLAMHLWPERVVPKCATDRSLAIAHGLEEFFWIEGPDGKWTPRTTPLRTIEDLIRERNSPAVKAALSSLVEAPSAQTGATRARVRTSGATSRGDRH